MKNIASLEFKDHGIIVTIDAVGQKDKTVGADEVDAAGKELPAYITDRLVLGRPESE
jgi:hypothetical protein